MKQPTTSHVDDDISSWVHQWGDELYRYALKRTQNKDVSHDLVQDTFLAAWQAKANFKGQSSRKTWLIGILKHKIIDHIRQQIRQRQRDDDLENNPSSPWFQSNQSWREPPSAWHDNPERLCHDHDFRQTLENCLSHLPEQQRQVFILRQLSGEDSSTICNTCQITPTNLHVLMHRARLALRHCLQRHGFGVSS